MKHTLLLSAICCLLLVGSCNKQKETCTAPPIGVMTFNIRLDTPSDDTNNWMYRKDNVCRMIAYYQPDLLGMQEVCHNQMEDLKHCLPLYTALGVGRDDGKEMGEYCPVFFNTQRFDLLEYGNFSLSETPGMFGIKGWDASYNRITTWAILQERNTSHKLAFFNTHLDNDGAMAREKSIGLILSKVKEIVPQDTPVIITGDFNCRPGETPLQLLEQGKMKNASDIASITYGPLWSFHAFGNLPLENRVLLDYVFVSEGITVNRYRVIDDTPPDNGFLSDHNPVLVGLNLDPR